MKSMHPSCEPAREIEQRSQAFSHPRARRFVAGRLAARSAPPIWPRAILCAGKSRQRADEVAAAFKSALENTAKDLGNGNPLQAITGARSSQGRESLGAADRHRSRAVSC